MASAEVTSIQTRLQAVEMRRIRLPLVSPFRTSFGVEADRDILLLRSHTSAGEGWGECVALAEPVYSAEYIDGVQDVLRRHLLPRLFACERLPAAGVGEVLRPVLGHRMAKAAIEMAVLDAELRARGESFASHLGAVREAVDCGVSVGIQPTVEHLLDVVEGHLVAGYRRVKLKIEPGWDLEPVGAVRRRFPDLPLQVDANAAYTLADARHLARLDAFDLLLIEQPLPEDQVRAHAALARVVRTPICLDESIVSARAAADAIALGACAIVNIKPGRVGGYLEAVRVHDVCAAHGMPVWMGGMLETGLGRAGNVAMAAMPGFTLPGDTSASDRYYREDITEPFVMTGGRLQVPTGPGLGVTPDPGRLAEVTTSVEVVRAPGR
jgi:O-succinylbenzoate synthase